MCHFEKLDFRSDMHGTGFSVIASFREARNLVLESYCDGLLDDEEFLLLYDLNMSKNPEFPFDNYERFNLETLNPAECKAEFRFEKSDLPLLTEALRIPGVIRCAQTTVCDGTEGLCMLLRRLAYLCRYSDLIPRFGRPVPEISMITSEVLDFSYENHNHRVTGWNDVLLNPASLQLYANAVFHKGAPLENCFGFVDGTVQPICRPS